MIFLLGHTSLTAVVSLIFLVVMGVPRQRHTSCLLSRKRKALETISQLEINTNNNEEILREARATRRSAFLRYMAAAFL